MNIISLERILVGSPRDTKMHTQIPRTIRHHQPRHQELGKGGYSQNPTEGARSPSTHTCVRARHLCNDRPAKKEHNVPNIHTVVGVLWLRSVASIAVLPNDHVVQHPRGGWTG
uniref:Uncharacterized protein n=1 Tax=Eutreptiella gymnastica TaxID=73025 RepID=A0A7S1I469_9EUGL